MPKLRLEDEHDPEAERMARGYLALTAGNASRALRLLVADRLAEINARAHLRRVAARRRLTTTDARHG